jgi:hypothetical protein
MYPNKAPMSFCNVKSGRQHNKYIIKSTSL